MKKSYLGLVLLAIISFVFLLFWWFLQQRQDHLASLESNPLPSVSPSAVVVDLDPMKDAQSYTTLLTLRGYFSDYNDITNNLTLTLDGDQTLGNIPVKVDVRNIKEVVCWPEQVKSTSGESIFLKNAYMPLEPGMKFYRADQKLANFASTIKASTPETYFLIKLTKASQYEPRESRVQAEAEQVVILGCR